MEINQDYYHLKNFKMQSKKIKQSILGKGSNATVYLVEHALSKELFAIKTVF